MTHVRQPAVAGMFYPDGAEVLKGMVQSCLAEGKNAAAAARVPKAVIAPHAGYIYSGPVAGTAYAQIAPARDVIQRVVLLGPSHRVPFRGLALSSADSFMTPLGSIRLDKKAAEAIQDLPQIRVLDEAHESEHSLEVQCRELPRINCLISICSSCCKVEERHL